MHGKSFCTSQFTCLASVLHLSSGRKYRMRLSPQPLPAHASGILGFSGDSWDASWILLSRPNYTHTWLTSHHHGHGLLGNWNAKVGSQELPGVTGKFGLGVQNGAGQRLTEFCKPLFQQPERRLYTWTSPEGQHQNQIRYILYGRRWISSIQLAKTRLGADCGSDHELLIAKLRPKLKKMGKINRPFRYDLNQIPHDYTVEVTDSRD